MPGAGIEVLIKIKLADANEIRLYSLKVKYIYHYLISYTHVFLSAPFPWITPKPKVSVNKGLKILYSGFMPRNAWKITAIKGLSAQLSW